MCFLFIVDNEMNHNAFFLNLVFFLGPPFFWWHLMALHSFMTMSMSNSTMCMCVWYEMSTITNSHVRCDVESEMLDVQVDVVVFEVDEVDERPTTRTNKEMKMNEDENKSINTVWCYCYGFHCCLFMPFLCIASSFKHTNTRASRN